MLDPRQLTDLRTTASAAFDLSGIVVKRPTRTKNATAGYSQTLTTLSTVAGAWNKPSASVMAQYAGLIGSMASWEVRLPYGTSVRNGDQLSMPSGDTLTVQADLSERSYATCVRVLATEVR